MGGEAHGWTRRPYGDLTCVGIPEQQRDPTFALTGHGARWALGRPWADPASRELWTLFMAEW